MTGAAATDPIAPFIGRTRIAYFSMEIAIRQEMHTYAGGLGILAGDTVRSAADLELPLVFVTLASRAGYFRQCLDAEGNQGEEPDWWELDAWCTPLDAMVAVRIAGRAVWIRPWLALHTCPHGHTVPILLLDTDLEQNAPDDRALTDFLYGGDEEYRLKQEIVLGIGGYRLLMALGFEIETYHLNEGHAALLTLELMKRFRLPPQDWREGEPRHDLGEVRELCVFTTHTPVEAGHDRFDYGLVERLLPEAAQLDEIRRLAGGDNLNMTRLALNLSGYVNGVARRHARTTEQMFPGYRVRAVTNGVHPGTWTHPAFARLFDRTMPQWQHEPEILVRAMQLDGAEVWACHHEAKRDLLDRIRASCSVGLDPDLPVIGFARRMTGYKRPLLLFSDLDRLIAIAGRQPFQIVLAGKAHPRDWDGKEAIRQLHELAGRLGSSVPCAYLPNHDMAQAKLLVAGTDIWLNTPLPPMEASGTSGMKAALNGVLNLSVPDGWWLEACIEGVTGWSIGNDGEGDGGHSGALYEKLGGTVLPLYHNEPDRWRWMMKQSIGNIASYFNSQRMMRRYASEAYLR
jgi:starch phosphorylase